MRATLHLVFVTAVLGCATGKADPAHPVAASPDARIADSAAAHAAAAGFITAFDSLQWERFRSYLAEDMTMFFPFPQIPGRVDGRDSVEAIFGMFMRGQRESRERAGRPMVQGLTPRDLRVQMAGPHAAVATFHLGPEGGPPQARRSVIFARTATGEWKVVHWHASSPPPRPTPQPSPPPPGR
jgi:ketosteroid isomerase-like protein